MEIFFFGQFNLRVNDRNKLGYETAFFADSVKSMFLEERNEVWKQSDLLLDDVNFFLVKCQVQILFEVILDDKIGKDVPFLFC